MKNKVKISLLSLALLFILVLSASSAFSQDFDNSTNSAVDNGEYISIENQNDLTVKYEGCTTDSMSGGNDEGLIGSGEIVEPMPQVDAGVVSGGVDYIAVNPGETSGNLIYTIPENMTNLKSAIVIVNVYSGSGANTHGLYSNVTLNTNRGLEVLGYEALVFDLTTSNDPNVYAINDHTTKQYSDYQMLYDITDRVNDLASGDTIGINVVDSPYGDKSFDGKIKLISLLFAYDDGDSDSYAYWLYAGQLWSQSTAGFDFNTRDYAGKKDNISLRSIALTSIIADSYKINDVAVGYDAISEGYYYKDLKWNNISSSFTQGSDTSFSFEIGSGSYKTNVALLIASEIETYSEVYVDYANGDDNNFGTRPDNAFKTIEHALGIVQENGIIYISGVNYLDGVGVEGLSISKNVSIVGLGSDATIDARKAGRIFNIGALTVRLSNLRFLNGDAGMSNDKCGGALYADGATLNIDNCTFINNTAGDSESYGRAIYLKSAAATITDSILLDGEKSVWTDGGSTDLESNWWGNNETTKDSNPKDLGYTNADVSSYLYLTMTMFATGMDAGDTASVNVMLVSIDGKAVDIIDVPVTLTAMGGTLSEDSIILINGVASVEYTITSVGNNIVTADVLGIKDSYSLSSSDIVSTEVIYVNSTGGVDTNPGSSWGTAVQTIEKAISIVSANGTVYVADGRYSLSDSTPETGIAITKNITVIGQSTNAVISGGNAKRIFIVNNYFTLTICNLTLTEAYIKGNQIYGGAISLEDNGKLIISDSVISNSYATYGGAIGTQNGAIDNVHNVTFVNNSADAGGALNVQSKNSILVIGDNNKFINCSSNGRGSAIYSQSKVITGKNNLFYANKATGRYGIGTLFGFGFTIGTANVFVNNIATTAGALFLGGSKTTGSGSYCIFINNSDSNGYSISKQIRNLELTLDNCYWGTNNPILSNLSNYEFTCNSYLVLNVSSNSNELRVGENLLVTADLTRNNLGEAVDGDSLPDTLPLIFTVVNGNVNPVTAQLLKGVATTTYAPNVMGEASVTANVYVASETLNLNILPELGTVFVNYTGGLDTNDGDSWDNAVKTIKRALEMVGNGNTIYIADGVNYLDDATAEGLSIDKNVTVIGMGDNVIIDANNNGRIFNIGACNVRLSNLVFINANAGATSGKRGGSLLVNGATLSIDNCRFINNTAGDVESYGGAINLISSTTNIINSYFEGNSAFCSGGAIYADSSNILLEVSGCTFTRNGIAGTGLADGGAISSDGTVIIDRSIFYGNILAEGNNGRSVSQYGTGDLTIANSILLDGDKSVHVSAGAANLENNWWGNNDITKDSNPKDLGYTNADVTSYMVLSSKIRSGDIYETNLVTVTTTLENNVVELPIILDVDIGSIVPSETKITSNEVSVYNATVMGDEVITINVLGIENVIKFKVKERIPLVQITEVKTQWLDGIYPAVNNTFTIGLNSEESGNVEGLVLEVYSDENGDLIARYVIDSLSSGVSTIRVTDPTIRPLTEQTVWPAPQDSKIKFTFNLMRGEDVVSTLSVDKMLAYDGYFNKTYAYGGHDNVVNRNYTINGDLIIATQDVSVYSDQFTRYRKETWNIEIPEDAELVKAFLYFNYNWDTSYFPDGWQLSFNDMNLLEKADGEYIYMCSYEMDRGNLGGWGAYNYGLIVFDVTDYVDVIGGNNSFVISKTGNCALYPSTLYVLYNVTESTSVKDIYFSDICDVYYPNYNQFGYDELLRHVVYYNGIDVDNLVNATWYVFSGSSSMNNNLTFNDGIVVNPFSGYTANDCRPYIYNVTALIKNNNEAWFISSVEASTTVAYEQVLVVERILKQETSITVANDTVDLDIGDEFDIGAVLTPDVGELTYSSSNESVAVVENGRIIAKGAGNAIVTVSFEGNNAYAPSSATVIMTVHKLTPTITVDSLVVDVDGSVDVGASSDSDGALFYVIADGAVASVSDAGVVTGLKGGSTTLTVSVPETDKYDAKEVNVTVTVNKLNASISVSDSLEVIVDGTVNVGATTNSDGALSYVSNDTGVASVSDAGVVSGLKGGKVKITVSVPETGRYNAKEVNVTVTVNKIVTSISVINSTVVLNLEEVFDIGAVLTPDVGELIYTSSNESVAVVSDGRIIAKGAGGAIVTVSFLENDKYLGSDATVNVVVAMNSTSISVINSTVVLDIDDEFDIGAVLIPDVGELTYSSSNESVAVIENGRIIAKGAGNAIVTVSFAGNENYVQSSATVDVTVNKLDASISVSDSLEVSVDGSVNVGATTNSDGALSYVSNDTGVTCVSDAGVVTGLKGGKVKITVSVAETDRFNAQSVDVIVAVNKLTPSISVSDSLVVDVDGAVSLGASTNSDGALVYVSNDTGVACVSDAGVVTGLKGGKVKITVSVAETDRFNAQSVDVIVAVNKLTPSISVSDSLVVDVDGAVSLGASTNSDGALVYVSNDTGVACVSDAGVVTGLKGGKVKITVSVAETDRFNAQSVDVVVTVNKLTPSISVVDSLSVDVGGSMNVGASTNSDGALSYVIVDASVASVSDAGVVTGLKAGATVLTVSIPETDRYNAKEVNVTVTVNKLVPTVSVPDSLVVEEGGSFTISLPEDAAGYLFVDVGDKQYSSTVNNGKATVTLSNLNSGSYNANITYSGDEKYAGVSKSIALNVRVPAYEISGTKDISVVYSATASYVVLVTKDGKAVGAGESVIITYNGKKSTVKTDTNGYATLKLNTNVKVKTYPITAECNGVKVTGKVTIKHVINVKNIKVKKSRSVTKVKITLNKVNGKVLKSKAIKIKFNGKTYKAKTNKKGVAIWKVKKSMLKKLKVGKKYKYTVTYGNDVLSKKMTIKR